METFKSRGTASTRLKDALREAVRNPHITGPFAAFAAQSAAMPTGYHPSDYLLVNTAANAYGAFDQFKYGIRLLFNGEALAATYAMAASFWSAMNAIVSSIPFADLILTGDPMKLQYWGAELPAIGILAALTQTNLAKARKLEGVSKWWKEVDELHRKFIESKKSLSGAELDRWENLCLELTKLYKGQLPYTKTDHPLHKDYIDVVRRLRESLILALRELDRRSRPDPSLN